MVFLLPFEANLVPIGVILFSVTNLFAVSWSERVKLFKERKFVIFSLIAIYLVHVTGMLYSSNIGFGLFDLEIKLSLFLLPIVTLTSNIVNKYSLPEILKTYVFGVIVSALFCLVQGTYSAIQLNDFSQLYYIELSRYLHPGYFSMYVNFAIGIVLIYILHKKNKIIPMPYFILTFLIVFVYMLSSRTGLLVLLITILYGSLFFIFPKFKFKRNFFSLLMSIIVAIGIVIPTLNSIYARNSDKIDVAVKDNSSSFGVRLAMWKYSTELMLEHPFCGVGTGDVKDKLHELFVQKELTRAIENNYNAHNQYVQTMIALGIIGLFALIAQFAVPFFFAWKAKSIIYVLYTINLFINFATESIIETQAGVIFVAVMNSMLFFTYKDGSITNVRILNLNK